MHVYLDNAASTPLDEKVLDAMLPYFTRVHGNPSSIHFHGREAKAAIEKARKTVAGLLNTSPSEIFFTSGGTEADNTAIISGVNSYKIKHFITSPLEHHAVLHTAEHLHAQGIVQLHILEVDRKGNLNYEQLNQLLESHSDCMLSLMHGNNEIGNINDIEQIGDWCNHYKALFHSDTVQTAGHYLHDLSKLKVDFIVGSAHKFHGPKGVGFLYVNAERKINPIIFGGAQERNMRGGTENLAGIIGLAKALEISYEKREEHEKHISKLKTRMIEGLKARVNGIDFNGNCTEENKSLYTILNVALPGVEDNDMLLFKLDIDRISASAGSACSSGTNIGSHVLRAIKADENRGHVRFSFSKYNTADEVDYVVEKVGRFV